MQETSQVGWLLNRQSRIYKSGQLKINSIRNWNFWKQVNCLSSGSDDENRGAMRTTRTRQCCTRWSLAKSLLAMLFIYGYDTFAPVVFLGNQNFLIEKRLQKFV